MPLAAYHSEEILPPDSLPRRYVGYSPSFRREAGSHGKDTRGIFRVHWFDKVEMFVFCAPEDAEAEHQQLLDWEKQFIDALELPYRVIDVAAGDLGLSAARKYDCEAWLPTQERYREITSTSNCTEYQARRLNIRGRYDTGGRAGRHPERDPVRDAADDRHAAGEPPAGGRLGPAAGRAAAVPRRTHAAVAGVSGSSNGWRPRVVALDVDGTVLDHDGSLPAEVRAAVRAVVDAGVPVVLSTGRSWHSTLPVVEQLGLAAGPSVCSNGAVIVDFPPERIVKAITFDPRAVIEKVDGVRPRHVDRGRGDRPRLPAERALPGG